MKFIDGKIRRIIPYKGWCIVKDDGSYEPDPIMATNFGPLKKVDDIAKHIESNLFANRHITYNLLNKNGFEILPRWVRDIKYDRRGFYIIEDNNEDEQIEKYGCIHCDEYWQKFNVVTNDGVLLSDVWFEKIVDVYGNYIHVVRDGQHNLIDFSGNYMLHEDADFCTYYNGKYLYCYRDGALNKAYSDGREEVCKYLIECKEDEYELSKNGSGFCRMVYLNKESIHPLRNILLSKKHLLFDSWYEELRFSGKHGLYFAGRDGWFQLIDMAGNTLTDFSFHLPIGTSFKEDVAIVVKDGYCSMINTKGDVLCTGYSSVLWRGFGELWEMNLFTNGKQRHFYNGQGGEVVSYAHSFLLDNKAAGLFEKDGVWYYPDENGNMVSLFEFRPDELL